MENKLKWIASVVVILVFAFFSLASLELSKESTDEVVTIDNCMSMSQVSGKLRVEVHSTLPGHYGMMYISQQKVKPDTCDFNVITNYRVPFNVDNAGTYVFQEDQDWFHDNSEDLWRIEVQMRAGSYRDRDVFTRQVQVQKYNTSNFNFQFIYRPTL